MGPYSKDNVDSSHEVCLHTICSRADSAMNSSAAWPALHAITSAIAQAHSAMQALQQMAARHVGGCLQVSEDQQRVCTGVGSASWGAAQAPTRAGGAAAAGAATSAAAGARSMRDPRLRVCGDDRGCPSSLQMRTGCGAAGVGQQDEHNEQRMSVVGHPRCAGAVSEGRGQQGLQQEGWAGVSDGLGPARELSGEQLLAAVMGVGESGGGGGDEDRVSLVGGLTEEQLVEVGLVCSAEEGVLEELGRHVPFMFTVRNSCMRLLRFRHLWYGSFLRVCLTLHTPFLSYSALYQNSWLFLIFFGHLPPVVDTCTHSLPSSLPLRISADCPTSRTPALPFRPRALATPECSAHGRSGSSSTRGGNCPCSRSYYRAALTSASRVARATLAAAHARTQAWCSGSSGRQCAAGRSRLTCSCADGGSQLRSCAVCYAFRLCHVLWYVLALVSLKNVGCWRGHHPLHGSQGCPCLLFAVELV